MGTGVYVCENRVVRDGVLIAFAGERMTLEEARHRGLLEDGPVQSAGEPVEPEGVEHTGEPDGGEPVELSMEALMAMKADELESLAIEIGLDLPKGATKPVMAQAILDGAED